MSDQVLIAIIAVSVALVAVAAAFVILDVRRRQSRDKRPLEAPPAPPQDFGIQDTAIQSLSARLAALEGRIGTLAATLDGLPILQSQVAAMQTNMPSLQQAYEQYADQISRADKRDTERDRRNRKDQGQTAGEAAAALTGVTGAQPSAEPTQPVTPSIIKRDGILGQGGRGRNRKSGLKAS